MASPERLQSLDQFRGYTVAGMWLVNFVGGYAAMPQILKHTHDYCSYADTIMPHFLFAAGFALRAVVENDLLVAWHVRLLQNFYYKNNSCLRFPIKR